MHLTYFRESTKNWKLNIPTPSEKSLLDLLLHLVLEVFKRSREITLSMDLKRSSGSVSASPVTSAILASRTGLISLILYMLQAGETELINCAVQELVRRCRVPSPPPAIMAQTAQPSSPFSLFGFTRVRSGSNSTQRIASITTSPANISSPVNARATPPQTGSQNILLDEEPLIKLLVQDEEMSTLISPRLLYYTLIANLDFGTFKEVLLLLVSL